jgi:SAM-dependent methyltransferase
MKIDYIEHYNDAYWQGKKEYQSGGQTHHYHGPSLTWEGFKMIADIVAPLVPGKSILDIGCSAGSFVAEFQKRGYDAYGVDISEHAVKYAVPSMKGRLCHADISSKPHLYTTHHRETDFPQVWPDRYDVVSATDLLEHLYEEDLDRTFDWMVAKSNKWLFFCVATCHDPANPSSFRNVQEFVHTKGADVPPQWEATAVAGHVHVRRWQYWAKYFQKKQLTIRWDLMYLLQMAREFDKGFLATLGWHHGNTWILEKR